MKRQLMWEGSRLLELTVCVVDIVEFCFCRCFYIVLVGNKANSMNTIKRTELLEHAIAMRLC